MKRATSRTIPLPAVLDFERHGFIVLYVLPAILLVVLVSVYTVLYAFQVSLYETRFLA
jgi:ABC-type sugar transport system permease subunit